MALCSATLALLCLMFVGKQVLDCGVYCVACFAVMCCFVVLNEIGEGVYWGLGGR